MVCVIKKPMCGMDARQAGECSVLLVWDLQGVILFDIGDKKWTLDLSSGNGSIKEGESDDEDADVTLTMSGVLPCTQVVCETHPKGISRTPSTPHFQCT